MTYNVHPHLKLALQSRLSSLFPVGKKIKFIRTVGFKAEPIDSAPICAEVIRIEHPWIVVEANNKEYKLYEREIQQE